MHISLMAYLHMHKGKSFPTQTAFNLQPIFPLQRYCAKEVTTDIHFYESNMVGRPALSICPEFTQAYHEGVVETFGIEKDMYKIGDWPRTRGVNEHDVFDQVTKNISQILRGIEFGFVGARDDIKFYDEALDSLEWTPIAYDRFGISAGADVSSRSRVCAR